MTPRKFALATRMAWHRNVAVLLGSFAMLVFLPGCPPPSELIDDELLPEHKAQGELPGYTELIHRYNARLVGVDLVSCRTEVEATWLDDKGRPRRESGKGRLIFRRPLDTALTVEAFGKTVMWAGSNDFQYWLFANLHEDGEVFFGRFGADRGGRPLPMPVSPDTVPFLLGLMPLEPYADAPDPPAVEAFRGYALIEPPGLPLRFLLEPETGTPRRVDVIDRAGNSAVICVLNGGVEVEGRMLEAVHVAGGELMQRIGDVQLDGRAAAPLLLPEEATIYPADETSRMTVEFKTAKAQDPKVRDQLFDLDVLIAALKPQRIEDLDR